MSTPRRASRRCCSATQADRRAGGVPLGLSAWTCPMASFPCRHASNRRRPFAPARRPAPNPWPGLPFERAVHSALPVRQRRPRRGHHGALRPRPDPGPATRPAPNWPRNWKPRAWHCRRATRKSARSISISATWTRPAIRPTAIAGAIGSSTAAAACGAKTWPAPRRPLRPAKAIALALNGDYAQVLEDYARRLESASSEEKRRRLQRKRRRS